MQATGNFEVKITPQAPDSADFGHSRMAIAKQFHGELEGQSRGEMLAAATETKGSAGYVAIEKVSGKLAGKEGTFVLQHSGTMTRGVPALSVTVVPDSGTGELIGLAGRMEIDITGGQHLYTFEYSL